MSILLALTSTLDGYACTSPGACTNQAAGYVSGVTPRRIWATVAVLVSLGGVAIGGLALVRSRRGIGHGGRNGAFVAVAAGLIGVVNGALDLAVADGGLGTGNGVAGGAIALVLGLVATGLGWRVLARSRRAVPGR